MDCLNVALVFSPHEWVETLHRHCTNTGSLKIRSLAYDTSVLKTQDFKACIISDTHPALNKGFVEDLHQQNKQVLCVSDLSNNSLEFSTSINVDAVFSSKISATELSHVIKEFLITSSDTPNILESILDEKSEPEIKGGRCIAFLGSGGTGCSEISLSFSSRLIDALHIDCDFEHPSLAQRCGLEIEPNLIDAIEASINYPEELIGLTQKVNTLSVIPGIAHSSYAKNLKEYEIDIFINQIRRIYQNNIFDLGRISKHSLFFDYQKKIIEACDDIFITSVPTPNGILRTLEKVDVISGIFSGEINRNISIILSGLPKKVNLYSDIENELKSYGQIANVYFLPTSDSIVDNIFRAKISEPKQWNKEINKILSEQKISV
ncbi:MAG: hypothetical protein U0R17_03455 [Acidimicrobiia bacterium]